MSQLEKITIIYQDKDILVVNKPAGVVVNRAQTVKGETLQDWLELNVKEIAQIVNEGNYPVSWQDLVPKDFNNQYGTPKEIFLQRSGIAHRLDKDTSGVMLVAKHPGSLLELLRQFREREVQKQYLCLVHGRFALPKGEISVPLGRRSSNRKLFGVVPGGRQALTYYEVQDYFANFDLARLLAETGEKGKRFSLYNGFSLVKCWPKTGRTHQIRVHLAHLAHPVVGDRLYLGKKRIKLDILWCSRQFLHAQEISFKHPRTGKEITLVADLSDDLVMALSYLS